jgi:Domain of unknown function (DUF4177)
MAIKVSCPSCGAKRTLPDVYRGRSVTCPKCGAGFPANPSNSSSGSVEALAALPEDYVVPSGIGFASSSAPTSVVGVKLQAAPVLPLLEAPKSSDSRLTGEHPAFKLDPPKEAPAQPTPASTVIASPTASAKREYKVLTRQNLWFTGQFDPKAFEEALNTYGQQGWTLKSTMVMTFPTPEGDREDVIVVLER